MIKGIIFEGITGSGKTTLYRHILRHVTERNCSLFSLNEHCTERSLEPLRSATLSDSLDTLKNIITILHGFQNLSCKGTDPLIKLFLLERFHMSHCLDITRNDKISEYTWVDKHMQMFNSTVLLLTIDPSKILERCILNTRRTRPESWSRYLSTLGTTDDAIVAYYQTQQEHFISLCAQSALPVLRIDTSSENWPELSEHIITNLLPGYKYD
jgi:thymidylate kinase